ncbi:MAG: hypothetical protein ACHQ7M_22240 [Chloroflexota bacterium]
MPQVALLTIHGMGEMSADYAEPLFSRLRERLAGRLDGISFHSVYYETILKPNQEVVWARLDAATKLHYDELRRFLLFGLGDAAGLENRKELDGSAYEQAQEAIARQLLDVYRHSPDATVVFLAQSLGCQVLSSYIYDAQKAASGAPVVAGIWKDLDAWSLRALQRPLLDAEKRFIGGVTCTAFLTTGCNIPIFVAAHKTMDIKPIAPLTPCFKWLNIYDPDDVLGWPLQPLSPGYAVLVEDRPINAGQGMVKWILESWNPLSHLAYWTDTKVIEPLAALLLRQI